MTLVAIHQPNFLPWPGYFDKLVRADVFVALDHVQYPKGGAGNWVNRVQILHDGEPRWLTLPVVKPHGMTQCICDVRIAEQPWRASVLGTLRANYRQAPFFESVFPTLEAAINAPASHLASSNLALIRTIAHGLGIDPRKIIRSSVLPHDGQATELLVSLVKAVGGTAYLAGGGAGGYQQDEMFHAAGIEVVYQRYTPVPYDQGAPDFVPGLSVVDALMHLGWEGVAWSQFVEHQPIRV